MNFGLYPGGTEAGARVRVSVSGDSRSTIHLPKDDCFLSFMGLTQATIEIKFRFECTIVGISLRI